jgi:glycosyltransferase involved in cell wall biosynthesis
MSDAPPVLSVVVPAHGRPLRLRWLLNALQEQTLDRSWWEVVVCHNFSEPADVALVASHPLARDGTLRITCAPARTATPGSNRNVAVALSRAPTIVFTDDDTRPPPEWLAQILAAVREHPDAILQGPTLPDPDERVMQRSAHPRTQEFTDVPTRWAECCNIVYPRSALDAVGGLLEGVLVGEDTDLNLRVRSATGLEYLGDPRLLTYHAVDAGSLLDALRGTRRWVDMPLLVKRQPQVRRWLPARIFWKRTHLWLLQMVAGLGLAPRDPRWLALGLPWALAVDRHHGNGARGIARDVAMLPGYAAIDVAEMLALVRGSLRHATVLL